MRIAIMETEKCVGCQMCMFACSRRHDGGGLAKACIAVRSVGGFERGFTVVVCRACDEVPCARVCPTKALEARSDGGVILNLEECIGCGYCREACLIGAIQWDDEINKPMICSHCGYCVTYCPHGVLGMEKKEKRKTC